MHIAKAVKEYEDAIPAYEEARDKYRAEDGKMYMKFREEALENCGLANHPNKEKIFSYVWNECHHSGYYSVWQKLEELSDLFD